MKNRLVHIFIFTALLTLLTVSNVFAVAVTLDSIADKKPGDTVAISGTTTFNETSIKVIAPSTTILYIDVVKGTPFNNTFDLPSDASEGAYTVVAGQDSELDTVTFNVSNEGNEGTTVSVTGVSLDKTAATVKVGEILQLTATVTPEDATNKGVTWSSSDETVATVDQTGKVKVIEEGSATITATTEDGNYSATCEITVEKKSSSSSGGSSSTTPKDSTKSKTKIIIGGESQEDILAVTDEKVEGKTVTTVKINGEKLIKLINKQKEKSKITIPVDTDSDTVKGGLTGDIVKAMEEKDIVLEIQTNKATYILPAAQINIEDISQQIGTDVELEDIEVEISIAEPNEQVMGMLNNAASEESFVIVGTPIEFKVSCSYGDKNIAVSRFNQYIQREILIPDDVDPNKPLTGVVLNNDGTISHVPTKIVIRDGKKYAVINSLTNSTYTVVSREKAFADVESHWAKEEINNMASRLIINGTDENTFAPKKDITRAEFATIITKALGLRGEESTLTFSDIQKGAWYYDAVGTAYEYGIVGGYEDNTFRANQKITRQEAMAMLSRAMKIAGMETEIEADVISEEISQFTDAEEIANWAKEGAAICIMNDIFGGSEGKITPKANITRGQTAAVVYRLLVNAGLI